MSLNEANKLQLAVKRLNNKAHTQQNFEITQEGIGTDISLSHATIFGETIDSNPISSGGLTTLYSNDTIVERVMFEVEIIPDTEIGVDQSQGYRLKLPTGYTASGFLGSQFSGGTLLSSALGKLQVVPSSRGQQKSDGSSEYDPILFTTNSGVTISKHNEINWLLDTVSGTLFVQDPPTSFDINTSRPGFVEGFLYVGNYLDEVVSGITTTITGVTGNNGISVSGNSPITVSLGGTLVNGLTTTIDIPEGSALEIISDQTLPSANQIFRIDPDEISLQSEDTILRVRDENLNIEIGEGGVGTFFDKRSGAGSSGFSYTTDLFYNFLSKSMIDKNFYERRTRFISGETLSAVHNNYEKGAGQITVESGSTGVTGTSTNFTATTEQDVGFWDLVWVRDSNNELFQIEISATSKTAATITTVYTVDNIAGGYVNNQGNIFSGVTGTYDYFPIKSVASGVTSFAFGQGAYAGPYSVAMGNRSVAAGDHSVVFGSGNTNLSDFSGIFASHGAVIPTGASRSAIIALSGFTGDSGIADIVYVPSLRIVNSGALASNIGLGFGDGTDGIYSPSASGLTVKQGGADQWLFENGNIFRSNFTGGPLLTGQESAGEANYAYQGDSDTGWVWNSANNVSLITSGVTAITVNENQVVTIDKLNIASGLTVNNRVISAATTISNTDYMLFLNTSFSGTTAFTVNLPLSPVDGQVHQFKDNGSGETRNIIISGNTKFIDGAATTIINTDYGGVTVTYDDVLDNWFITGWI